jgi:glycosyltransferase involved in cell wall biosynthesis
MNTWSAALWRHIPSSTADHEASLDRRFADPSPSADAVAITTAATKPSPGKKEPIFFSDRFNVLAEHLRSHAGDPEPALLALSDCLDLATGDLEFQLLRKAAMLMRQRQIFNQDRPHPLIADQLLRHQPINVVFINDNGVYAGAGIGVKRQAQSFALAGHNVLVLALNGDEPAVRDCGEAFQQRCVENRLPIRFQLAPRQPPQNKLDQGCYADFALTCIRQLQSPSLVILGNLHSCEISLSLIPRLMAAGHACVLYAHDLDWITGGCAYPQHYRCENYLAPNGCLDRDCPMPEDAYPMASWGRKQATYACREIIMNTGLLPVFTNSQWTSAHFKARFPAFERLHTVLLGTDTEVFRPSDQVRVQMRMRHRIPEDALVVAVGADHNSRPGKGGDEVERVARAMADRRNLVFLAVGHAELAGSNVINLGYRPSETSMAEVFQCADLFLNLATIDCFGQVTIEAAACGCVPLVLKGTGTSHAIEDRVNGLLLNDRQDVINAIDRLLANRELLAALSTQTHRYSSESFSLDSQYVRWLTSLLNDFGGCTPFMTTS